MTNTSKEAVENFIQSVLKEAVLSEGLPRTSDDTDDAYETIALLRALAAKLAEVEAANKNQIAMIRQADQRGDAWKAHAETAKAALVTARRDALEEAARVVMSFEYCHEADGIVVAIRALIDTGESE